MEILLQFALDEPILEKSLSSAASALEGGVDILEVGTPLIKRHGVAAVRSFCRTFPGTPIYADSKMIDFPEWEIVDFFEAGASYVSAAVCASDENICASLQIAEGYHGTLVLSTMGYPTALLARRVSDLNALGATVFVAHGSGTRLDVAFSAAIDRATVLQACGPISLAIGGGITASNANLLLPFRPAIAIVGRGISQSGNTAEAVRAIKAAISST